MYHIRHFNTPATLIMIVILALAVTLWKIYAEKEGNIRWITHRENSLLGSRSRHQLR
jgi:hypothetical protein